MTSAEGTSTDHVINIAPATASDQPSSIFWKKEDWTEEERTEVWEAQENILEWGLTAVCTSVLGSWAAFRDDSDPATVLEAGALVVGPFLVGLFKIRRSVQELRRLVNEHPGKMRGRRGNPATLDGIDDRLAAMADMMREQKVLLEQLQAQQNNQ